MLQFETFSKNKDLQNWTKLRLLLLGILNFVSQLHYFGSISKGFKEIKNYFKNEISISFATFSLKMLEQKETNGTGALVPLVPSTK